MFTIHYLSGKKFTIRKRIKGKYIPEISAIAGYFRQQDDPSIESQSVYLLQPIDTMLSNYHAVTSKSQEMLLTYHNILCAAVVRYLREQGYPHVTYSEIQFQADREIILPDIELGYMADDDLVKLLHTVENKF